MPKAKLHEVMYLDSNNDITELTKIRIAARRDLNTSMFTKI